MDTSFRKATADDLAAHAEFLRRLAHKLVPDEHLAEDAAQETALAALRRPPEDRSALPAWLARVVRRRAANLGRDERTRASKERDAARSPTVESSEEQIRVQMSVLSAVEALDEPYRRTIWLRFYEDEPPRRIATRMGVPVETVKTRLRRGLEQLRARLDGAYDGDRQAWCLALAPLASGGRRVLGATAMKAVGGLMAMSAIAIVVVAGWPTQGQEPLDSERLGVDPPLVGRGPGDPASLEEDQSGTGSERVAIPTSDSAGGMERASLALQVLWPEGDPAIGVEIGLVPQDANWPASETVYLRTDSRGEVSASGLRPGTILVYDHRGNRLEHELQAGARDRREFRLQSGIDVAGRVVDGRGEPVAEAGIWVGETETDGDWESLTNSAGEFHLRHVHPWGKVSARAPGFQPSDLEFLRWKGAQFQDQIALELRLVQPGGIMRGMVLDPEGKPVEGARVKIGGEYTEPAQDSGVGWVPLVETTTTREGVFEQAGLRLGTQVVHVLAEGFPVAVARVDVEADQVAWVDLRLEPPSTLAGVVTEDGAPVKGAEIYLYQGDESSRWRSAFPLPEARSSDDGSFQVDFIPAGRWVLRAEGPRGVGESLAEFDIGVGQNLVWNPALDRGLVVQGRVVDEYGLPLEHWSVTANIHGQFRRQCYTDRDGGFVLSNCPEASLEVTVRNLSMGLLLPAATVPDVVPGGQPLLLRVPPLEVFTGSVLGVALAGSGEPLGEGELKIEMEGVPLHPLAEFDSETGQFEFGNLGPGRYRVLASGNDGTNLYRTEWFELQQGGRIDLGVLTIGLPSSLVVFTRPDPRMIELLDTVRVRVQPVRGGDWLEPARTGANWRLDEIVPGDYWIQFSEPFDQSLRPFTVEPGERCVLEYDLNLCRETTVEFFEPVSGPRVKQLDVEVFDSDEELVWKWTRRAHHDWPRLLMVVSLAEGTYRIEAVADTGLRADVPLVIDWSRGREPHVVELR